MVVAAEPDDSDFLAPGAEFADDIFIAGRDIAQLSRKQKQAEHGRYVEAQDLGPEMASLDFTSTELQAQQPE